MAGFGFSRMGAGVAASIVLACAGASADPGATPSQPAADLAQGNLADADDVIAAPSGGDAPSGSDAATVSDAPTSPPDVAAPVADASQADAPVVDTFSKPPDGTSDSGNPCAGVTCGGKGQCSALYDEAFCKCDLGMVLLGTTTCVAPTQAGACHPNPCVAPDQGICSLVADQAVCQCGPGFLPVDGVCTFVTCPKLAARTGVTLYDQTGAGAADGFDPLEVGDVVKVRVDIEVQNGSGEVTLELQAINASLDTARLAFDGQKVAGAKFKGPILSIPLTFAGPGLHSVELLATLLSKEAPLSLNARLAAAAGCEIPASRSAARIGPLGQLDAKGFGCIDLDRTRSVQVTHDVVEKNTAVYGAANGIDGDYVPSASIVSTMLQCFTRQTSGALFLAGDALGQLPWAVDNYIVVEQFANPPAAGDLPVQTLWAQGQGSIGAAKGQLMVPGPQGDVAGTHFGIPNGSPFGFSAGHLRLDNLVPPGKATWLRFTALDLGVVGRLTRLYVHSVKASAAPRTCVSNAQCNGHGCVAGQCSGGPCSGACGANLFCVGGLCTSQCNAGGGSCDSGFVCRTRGCVPTTQLAGTCDASQQDQDCAKGQVCHWGRCEPGCHHPRHQDQSYAQDPGFCQGNKPGLCPHCPDPKQGCWNNVCAECEVDAHCGAGMVCVDRKCVVW